MLHKIVLVVAYVVFEGSPAKNRSPSLSTNDKDVARKVKVSCTSKKTANIQWKLPQWSPLHCGQFGKAKNYDVPFPVHLYWYKVVICLTDYTLNLN